MQTRRVDLAMLALVVVWGVNFPIVKIAFRELPPLVFNALRFTGATLLLLLVLWRVGQAAVPRDTWPVLLALRRWAGPRTAVYSNLIPVVTLAASWLLLGETLVPLQTVGAAVVLAGVALARA